MCQTCNGRVLEVDDFSLHSFDCGFIKTWVLTVVQSAILVVVLCFEHHSGLEMREMVGRKAEGHPNLQTVTLRPV